MSTALRERPAPAGAGNGGVPARRAVIRWAWRMFRREWRQQVLVLALIMVAVAATVLGAAVATNTPPPPHAGFGTADDQATFQSAGPRLAGQIAALQHRVGRVDVIENQTIAIPGSINTYDLRAQNPHGPFGQPMLALVSGRYPTGPGQVAVTDGVAAAFNLKIGAVWHQDGTARTVVGIVQNPQSLLDEFALVAPGQVSHPTQVTVLFDAPGARPRLQRRECADAGVGVGRATRSTRRPSCSAWPRSGCCSSPWWQWAASRCWRSAGCARSACSARWAPPTGTSGSWSGPTVSWWVWWARWPGRHWGWRHGWPTGRAPRPTPTM